MLNQVLKVSVGTCDCWRRLAVRIGLKNSSPLTTGWWKPLDTAVISSDSMTACAWWRTDS